MLQSIENKNTNCDSDADDVVARSSLLFFDTFQPKRLVETVIKTEINADQHTNDIVEMAHNFIEFDADGVSTMSTSDVYICYVGYCRSIGFPPVMSRKFGSEMAKRFTRKNIMRDGVRAVRYKKM